jgi:hypothetical protein
MDIGGSISEIAEDAVSSLEDEVSDESQKDEIGRFDAVNSQDYLIEVGKEKIFLKEVRESIFNEGKVLSVLDYVQQDELPCSVRIEIAELHREGSKRKESIFVHAKEVEKDSKNQDSSDILEFRESGVILKREKKKVIDDGTSMVEIEEVPWEKLPLSNLDIEITQIDKNQNKNLVFQIARIE